MCGRFTITIITGLCERFDLPEGDSRLMPRYNVAPGQVIPVIRDDGVRRLQYMEWGPLVRWKSGRIINARAESLVESPFFSPLIREGRCLVPADGFFEWNRRGRSSDPYYFTLRDGGLFAFAGLATDDACVIITTGANTDVAPIHDRMPAILRREDEKRWLSPKIPEEDAILEMCAPLPNGALIHRRVSARVNDPRWDDPSLLEPVKDGGQQTLSGFDVQGEG